MVRIEEANLFANGFDDPARLAIAFAGVAGNIGSNVIAIRGNSPQFIQCRLEGVEMPNPTYFADISGVGGGFLSALSNQVIALDSNSVIAYHKRGLLRAHVGDNNSAIADLDIVLNFESDNYPARYNRAILKYCVC